MQGFDENSVKKNQIKWQIIWQERSPKGTIISPHNAAVHIGTLGTALQRRRGKGGGTRKAPLRNSQRRFKVAATYSPTTQCSTIGDAVSLPLSLSLLPSPLPRAAGAHTAARPAPLMHCERGTAPLTHGT